MLGGTVEVLGEPADSPALVIGVAGGVGEGQEVAAQCLADVGRQREPAEAHQFGKWCNGESDREPRTVRVWMTRCVHG